MTPNLLRCSIINATRLGRVADATWRIRDTSGWTDPAQIFFFFNAWVTGMSLCTSFVQSGLRSEGHPFLNMPRHVWRCVFLLSSTGANEWLGRCGLKFWDRGVAGSTEGTNWLGGDERLPVPKQVLSFPWDLAFGETHTDHFDVAEWR